MISGFVEGLIIAWFLNLFGVGNIVIGGLQVFCPFTLTLNHYYLLFGILGMLSYGTNI